MTERPILFSAPMVRANRSGLKTQTRRTRGLGKINESPDDWEYSGVDRNGIHIWNASDGTIKSFALRCPYGVAGDRLWTKEAWRPRVAHSHGMNTCDCADIDIMYLADGEYIYFDESKIPDDWTLPKSADIGVGNVSSLFLPRWASRDTFDILDVRPERLQDITEVDAISEGLFAKPYPAEFGMAAGETYYWGIPPIPDGGGFDTAIQCYACLWESINGEGSWGANPWLWRIRYKKL